MSPDLIELLPGPREQLTRGLAWLAAAAPKDALPAGMIRSIQQHQVATGADPSILLATAVTYLATRRSREDDRLNRYWAIADQVSAQARARYQGIEAKDLR